MRNSVFSLFAVALGTALVFGLAIPTASAAEPDPKGTPAPRDTAGGDEKTETGDKKEAPSTSAPEAPAKPAARVVPPEATKLRKSGKIWMVTGVVLTGLGLAMGVVGAVLYGIGGAQDRHNMLIGGALDLCIGIALAGGGAALWVLGYRKQAKAEKLIIDATLRQYTQARPPTLRRKPLAAAPPVRTVMSLSLKF